LIGLVADDAASASPDFLARRRPGPALSILLDALLASGAYPAAYWLRFYGDQLQAFLPGAWATLPYVVGAQLLALFAVRAYGTLPGITWLFRVMVGIAAGTGLSAALVGLLVGYEGVSRSAFLADALLLTVAAIGWRGIWVLRMRSQARAAASPIAGHLVDRDAEMMTLGGIISSLYRYRELLRNLVLKDLKLKYRGSVFGFLWSLANPLLMIVVYTLAFTFILRVSGEGFVFCAMLGLLAWSFTANSATMATGAIVDSAGLLKSVLFPRAILPIATVIFNLSQYLLTFAVFLPVLMLLYWVPPSPPMLVFPVFLALQVTFTVGVALILSTGFAFFRDVRHLLEVALAVLFWLTPILYRLEDVPERLQLVLLMSPMSPFVVAYQQIFYFRVWPDGAIWLMATAHAAGAFVIGGLLFLSFEPRFTEQV
jgi:ABC-type polysaccharide/polyol phosphate export permease